MIPISIPLDFPKVVPNDWHKWNSLWEKNKAFMPKVHQSPNVGAQSMWVGFDIYVKDGLDATEIIKYKCENLNCPELFPSLFDNLDKLPINIQVVRVLQSLSRIRAHRDFAIESNHQAIRSLLYDNNPKQTWYYTDHKNKVYLNLPKETNTWWFDDSKINHGSDFYLGYDKQVIMYRGTLKDSVLPGILNNGIQKYPEYVIYI
jgi:hypothetical protein